jgi:amino acid adenylation domain-containing protein
MVTDLVSIDQALLPAAKKWPDRMAFRCRGATLTYGALEAETRAMAACLSSLGVAPGDRVAIAMTKGLEMPVAIHAIWWVGAAFVPLDPSAPVGRLTHIIRDCGISVVIGADRNAALLQEIAQASEVKIVGAEIPGAACYMPTAESNGAPPHRNAPDDLAYIIFTSGSTGTPKGICHSFDSGSGFAHAWLNTYQLRADDFFFSTVPLHFDFSLADFFTPAMVGAAVELVPEQVLLFPASLSKLLEDSGGTIWSSVPYTFIQLCERGAVEDRDLSALRWLIYGGEPLPPSSLPLLRKTFRARISNSYGPAEVNQVSEYTVPPEHPADRPVPIGAPMNHAVFTRSEEGELLVAASSMMSGYWNRPELNAKVFSDRDGTRYYHTGDRVETDAAGQWMFLGRADRQAKVRGYRVELDEIELALAAHDSVSEAAVIVSTDGLTLRGFVTMIPGGQVDGAQLKAHVGDRLPRYMVPDDIVICANLAKTSTGKIDRKALKEVAV